MKADRREYVADRIKRVALALLSAALLIVSLPSPDIGWLGWGALVPMLLAIQSLGPGRTTVRNTSLEGESMRPGLRTILLLLASCFAAAWAEPASPELIDESTNCNMNSIQASFKAALSTYAVEATCNTISTSKEGSVNVTFTLPWHWTSQGSYDPHSHVARETVTSLFPGATSPATAITTLSCPSDPWLGPSLGGGVVVCTNPQFNPTGDVMGNFTFLAYLKVGFYRTNLPNSTGFQYTRASLIAQRDAELKAEADLAAAALQKQNQRLTQSLHPAPPIVAPSIILPTANALFMQNAVVPIKILPPQGMTASAFLVKLERMDRNGNWTVVTNLPIGMGEATSPTGYTGWGAPGNGRDPSRMVSLPGSYRVSAQVSAPRQTLWSAPVPFVVTSPSKAIQKTPKMFGP